VVSDSAAQRYRKKPVVIEAMQFTDAESLKLIEWWSGGNVAYNDEAGVYCMTLEGPLSVSDNDWIIRGVQGEFYPVKPDIFGETYEPA
jgi:hypothetical protein